MKKKELKKKVADLERQVRDLSSQVDLLALQKGSEYHYHPPVVMPTAPSPWWKVKSVGPWIGDFPHITTTIGDGS